MKKDELALKVLDNFVNDLYNTCLMICNFVDPDKIIIGGGISDTESIGGINFKKIEESPLSNLYKPVVYLHLLVIRQEFMELHI